MCILTCRITRERVLVHLTPEAKVKRSYAGCIAGGLRGETWCEFEIEKLLLFLSLFNYT